MKDLEIRKKMYALYLLFFVYKEHKQLELIELNSIQSLINNCVDSQYNSKEKLIELIELEISKYFKNNLLTETIIEFKIAEVIKTDFSSSLITLKFILNTENKNITLFENEKKLEVIEFQN